MSVDRGTGAARAGDRDKPRRFTIPALLALGHAAILVAVLVLGWLASMSITELRGITQDLYRHPFAVSNAAIELRSTVLQLRDLSLRTVLLGERTHPFADVRREVAELTAAGRSELDIIRANFLGDMQRVAELEARLDAWDRIRQEVLDLAERGESEAAERTLRTEGTAQFDDIVPLVDHVLAFARRKGAAFVEHADRDANDVVARTELFVILLAGFVLVTGIGVTWRVHWLQRSLQHQATRDFLTGTPNRRHFLELTEREHLRSRRSGRPFALVVVDLDHFKSVNDRHGHQVGDKVLKRFCAVCQQNLRTSDTLGRIGGEEFAILLPETTLDEARDVVERVRAAVSESRIESAQDALPRCTASFGLTMSLPEDESPDATFARADLALYAAKEGGRDRVNDCVAR